MPINDIDLGNSPNDGQGDPLRVGGQKINANFDWLNANKIGISKRVQDLLNPNSTDVASTQAIYDALQGISGFNNNIVWKKKTLTLPDNPNVNDIVSAINNLPPLVITGNEQYYFNTYEAVVSASGNGLATTVGGTSYDIITKIWIFKRGKGTYGSGGTQINSGDILLLAVFSSQTSAPVVFDLGEIGTQNIEDVVNSSGPYGVSEGTTVVFKARRNGDPYTWIWIGNQETVGIGYPATGSDDYFSLNNITPQPGTDYITPALLNASLYDTATTGFSTDLSNFTSLTEKFYVLMIDDGTNPVTYYFASKENNSEDFDGSRIYISASGTKHDLSAPTVTQNGYHFWDLGDLGIPLNAQTGDWAFQAWFHTGENKIQQLETIGDLEDYTGEGTTILVKDSLRGGIFNYVASGVVVDNGVVFTASDGGFWQRQFDEANGVNVTWWGAIPDGATDLGIPTNQAIDFLGADGGKVTIPPGDYLISNSIRVKSNISLDATNANLTLADNSNQYMLRTANDFQNELDVVSNINITGGTWNANGTNQTLNITDANSLDTDFYGWAMAIVNSEKVKVLDLEIGPSLTWAISHINCNTILFDNIFVKQNAGQKNDDGITGNSSNSTLNNIYGYTNDNLIGIHNEILGFGGHNIPPSGTYFPARNVKNVTIKNITKYDSETIISTSALINNTVTGGYYADNIIIDGVRATVIGRLINIGNYNNGDGLPSVRNNLLINDIQVESINSTFYSGTININSNIDNLTINNVFRKDIPGVVNNRTNLIRIEDKGFVKKLNINNVVYETRYEASPAFGLIRIFNGFVGNIQANNISFVDTQASPICFLWATQSISNMGTTRIQASNVYMPNNSTEMIKLFGLYTASAHSISIDTNKEELTPETGDTIKEAGVLYAYNGTAWVSLENTPEADPVFMASAASGLLLHEQTITATELTNSVTTPVDLLPAPGAGKIIVVEKVVGFMDFQTTAYNSDAMTIRYASGEIISSPSNPFQSATADYYEDLLVPEGSEIIPNQSVQLHWPSITQGDGILHLKIYYRIVEF